MPRQHQKIEARAKHSTRQDAITPPKEPPSSLRVRSWEVVHACQNPALTADLIDAQRAAGMHPYAITESGIFAPASPDGKSTPSSLIDSWNDVRKWRRQLEMSDAQIVHAHCFPAAMASVRSGRPTVFDLRAFVEDQAITDGQCTERSWLARSFRTAEQFALTRASSVVVHSQRMQSACVQRGADADDVFIVPDPLYIENAAEDFGREWLAQAFGFGEDVVAIFADLSPLADQAETVQMQAAMLQAFAQVRNEVENARLFVTARDHESSEGDVHALAAALHVDDSVFVLASADVEHAIKSANIVVSGAENPANSPHDRVSCMQPNQLATQAMLLGRTLLAADSPANRDVSRDGRGCLWYQFGDSRDLAHRMAFLARNQDFCRALAQTGHKHLLESRNPEQVAKHYDQVYRHAFANGKRDQQQPGSAVSVLVPNAVSG